MVTTYELSRALPNKWLNPDGSITDFDGNVITPGSESMIEVYKNSKAIVNKFADIDGSTKTYSQLSLEIFIPVDELPEIGEKNKIYLVPTTFGRFKEYYWTDDHGWDLLGKVRLDLSDYPTFEQMNVAIDTAINTAIDTTITDKINEAVENVVSSEDIDNAIDDAIDEAIDTTINDNINNAINNAIDTTINDNINEAINKAIYDVLGGEY